MENNQEALKKKPLYKNWWVIIVSTVSLLMVIGSISDSQGKAIQVVTEKKQVIVENRCIDVPANALSRIEIGLTTDGFSLRNAKAVRSNDFTKVYFVSVYLQGESLPEADIATFSMNALDGPAMVLAIDDHAKKFTDWPDGERTQSRMTLNDDGARESRDCVRGAY